MSDYTQDDREFLLRHERVQLILKASVLAIPIKDMEFVQTTTVRTIATNGQVIFYNPEYIDRVLNVSQYKKTNNISVNKAKKELLGELRWRLAHIGVHIGFGHLADMSGKNKDAWHAACDIFADNLVNRFFKYHKDKRGWSDEQDFAMPQHNMVKKEHDTMSVNQLYKFYRAMPEMIPDRRSMDEHQEWDPELQDIWACKTNQAYEYWSWNFTDDKALQQVGAYIKMNLPTVPEDQADAWQMMQTMAEIEFLNSYSHYSDEEIKSALKRLTYRSPEDFAIIASRMAKDDTLRDRMLTCSEWLQASMCHKSYIM